MSESALEMALVPPLGLTFLLALITFLRTGWKKRLFLNQHWERYHWYVMTHVLFFFAAIATGVLGAVPLAGPLVSRHTEPAGTFCLNAVLGASFASCAFWIWRMKGFRWFAASLMTIMEVPVLGAVFMAGMSVTGDWL
jgi:hypothetical protein